MDVIYMAARKGSGHKLSVRTAAFKQLSY